jgi:kynurenine formamidase
MESVVRSLSRRDLMRLTATAIPAAAAAPALAQPAATTTPAREGLPLGASRAIDIALDPPISLTARRMIDLTHALDGDFPVIPVPGVTFPFRQEVLTTLDRHGVFANTWTMIDHNGTHIDATNHFHPLGYALEEIPIRSLVVPLVVIDITERAASDPDALVTIDDLRDWERRHGRIPPRALVAMNSGWFRKVGDAHAFLNMDASGTMHFPGFPVPTVEFLLAERDISGIGCDTISFDPGHDKAYTTHKVLFAGGKWGIENLNALDRVPPSGAMAFVGATKVRAASGGPARVLALA